MRAVLGGGPRLLLRRLREVMAEPVSAQARLDKIVVLIASNMVAEVCSVYVLRADATLELFATEGLNREAVHLTTMRSGEGLVGLIAQRAEPLALSEAQAHPAFSYKPETGEEIYHSFLGVPILRGGNTLGVLVVQNRAQPHLFRGGGRGAAGHLDAARRDDRLGRAAVDRAARRRHRAAPSARPHRHGDQRRHRPRPRRPARAAGRRKAAGRRECERRDAPARRGDRGHAGEPEPAHRAGRHSRHRRAPRRARSHAHGGQRPRLDAPAARGDCHWPHRRGGSRERAERRPRQAAALDRPVYARPPARSGRSRQPAPAQTDRPEFCGRPGLDAGQRHPGGAHDGAGGAARIRAGAAAWPGSGRRRAVKPCGDRRSGARHSGGRRGRQHYRPSRDRRRHHRRRHVWGRSGAAAVRRRERLC